MLLVELNMPKEPHGRVGDSTMPNNQEGERTGSSTTRMDPDEPQQSSPSTVTNATEMEERDGQQEHQQRQRFDESQDSSRGTSSSSSIQDNIPRDQTISNTNYHDNAQAVAHKFFLMSHSVLLRRQQRRIQNELHHGEVQLRWHFLLSQSLNPSSSAPSSSSSSCLLWGDLEHWILSLLALGGAAQMNASSSSSSPPLDNDDGNESPVGLETPPPSNPSSLQDDTSIPSAEMAQTIAWMFQRIEYLVHFPVLLGCFAIGTIGGTTATNTNREEQEGTSRNHTRLLSSLRITTTTAGAA